MSKVLSFSQDENPIVFGYSLVSLVGNEPHTELLF